MKELVITGEEERFTEQARVIELYSRNINPTQIAREVGIRRVDVLNHIDDWKKTTVGSAIVKERVEELMAIIDEHYGTLIRKAHEVIAEVDEDSYESKGRAAMLGQKVAAIKAAAELQSKRIDVLQKSGLLEAADMGDELAEMEEQRDLILDILSHDLCDNCRPKIMGKLAGEMGKDTVIVVAE